MKRFLIVACVLGGVVLGAGVAVLWLVHWPMRQAMRLAGISTPKGSRGGLVAVAIESSLALALSALGLHRSRGRQGPSWHPCEECGQPIDAPSRAAFCSESCRRHQSIRRRAQILADTDFA